MSAPLELDGSHGEGGGQILRSSLALSVLTGRPFRLVNIRANRPKPGLAPQHLASVRAAAVICGGRYTGGSVGSSVLVFEPGPVKSGNYTFTIGTAGATGLVLHTVYLPLALRGTGESRLTITGGTHVPHSPCAHFNETTWAAYLRRIGIEIEHRMARPGFYPRGGGEIRATIRPCSGVRGLTLLSCPPVTTADGFSAVADLPPAVNKRQARRLAHKLRQAGLECDIPQEMWENGPSTVAAVVLREVPVPTLFFGIGERGRPAEAVADEAVEQAVTFRDSGCPVDPHSADQIVLPLAFADGPSEYRVSEVTRHLLTNIDTIRRFVDRDISCDGEEGSPGIVRVAARAV
jgi:RNA 3'-terminal phosphate cyclase (ATP)